MSIAWLVPRSSAPDALCAAAGIAPLGVEDGDVEALAGLLAGREIIVTREVPVGVELLRRCRWIRGVVGVGPRAGEIVDWAFADSRGLLTATIVATSDTQAASTHLLATLAAMEWRLRSFDDVAEHWEGT